MLVKTTCEQCGGQMDFDTDKEQMYCPFCGNKIVNVAQKIQVSQHVTVEHKYKRKTNRPTLVINYKATDKSVKLVVRVVETNQKDVAITGQKLTYHLKPGKYNVVLKIGKINYNRVIYVPETYDTVNVNASWSGRAAISIDQPEYDKEKYVQEAREKADSRRKQQEEKEANMSFFRKLFLKRNIPLWIVAGVTLLFALVNFTMSPVAGVLMTLAAFIISPITKDLLMEKVFGGKKKTKALAIVLPIVLSSIIGFISLVVAGSAVEPITDSTPTLVENETQTSAEVETQAEPEKVDTEAEPEDVASVNNVVEEEEVVYDNFSLTMLDVDNGLSVVIDADGHYLLFDGGGRDTSSKVVSYLKKNTDAKLDYVVASHYDEDHISGIVGVLNTCKVETIIRPDYETDTEIYESFINHLKTNGAGSVFPKVGDEFQLGNAVITVLAPASYDTELENDRSIAIMVQYNKTKFIITSDAETESEVAMVDAYGNELAADLYVVGHHGSSSSTSDEFLNTVSPKYAFISSGEYNTYGHPTKDTLERLRKKNVSIFRTDKQGDVTVYSDGENLTFNTEVCEDYTPGKFMNPELADVQTVGETAAESSQPTRENGIAPTETTVAQQTTLAAEATAPALPPVEEVTAPAPAPTEATAPAPAPTETTAPAPPSTEATAPAPPPVESTTGAPAEPQITYIANTHTMKFHYPSCGDAAKIIPENRWDVTCTRQDMIDRGYASCGHCHP